MPDSSRRHELWLVASGLCLAALALVAYPNTGWFAALGHVTFALLGPLVFGIGFAVRPQLGIPVVAAIISAFEAQEGYVNPFVIAIAGGAWIVGAMLRSRQRLAAQLALRGRELDEERELFAQESVRYERARIARELHDIVAHCVSVMVVQAAAGQRLLASDPDLAAEALRNISETAGQAQTEMARLVELLDQDDAAGEVELGLVDELVARAQATGLRVSCRFVGRTDGISPATGDTVYRIVREALTNALKHAPGAPIAVVVDGRGESVEVSVRNEAPPHDVGVLHTLGGSNGIAGMRDRAAAVGGFFAAGPSDDGGWVVTAQLPKVAVA